MRKVVITGLGALTPVGNSAPETWKNLLAGRSGVARITISDPSDYSVQVAGEVKNFSSDGIIDPKEVRHMDRNVQLGVVAAKEALADARLDITNEDPDRVGIVMGTAVGGIGTLLGQQKV